MKKLLLIVNAVLGVLLSAVPFVLFPVCSNLKPDGIPMNCFYSGIFITIMGVLIVIFSLIALQKKLFLFSDLLSLICALMCWLVPNEIIRLSGTGWACSLCGNPEHACRASTMQSVIILISLIIILNFAVLLINFVKGNN